MNLLTAALLLAPAADGGLLDWRGKRDDPKAAMEDARRQGRAILLYFSSDG